MSKIYWLASYPKSGNTWLRALLTNYRRNVDEPADINDLNGHGGFSQKIFDEMVGISASCLTKKQIGHYRPLVYERIAAESRETIFFKVHDAFTRNADGQPIFSPQATAGAIYIIRNPLDVAVSYAHHQNETADKIIRYMNDDEFVLAGTDQAEGQLPQKLKSWSENVRSWTDAPEIDVHVVRYEDLLEQPVKAFTEIVDFAKLEVDEDRIKKAVEFSRFEQLQKQEKKDGFGEKQPTAASFFRQGKAGSWRGKLSAAQVARIIGDHREIMRRFGYLLPDDKIL